MGKQCLWLLRVRNKNLIHLTHNTIYNESSQYLHSRSYQRTLNAHFKLQTPSFPMTFIPNVLLNLRVQTFEKSAYKFFHRPQLLSVHSNYFPQSLFIEQNHSAHWITAQYPVLSNGQTIGHFFHMYCGFGYQRCCITAGW